MKQLIISFISILLSTIGFSQSGTKGSLLWEVSGNGITEPSYLFGTFHLMCKDQFPISEKLSSTIANTQQFYGELDMDDPTMQAKMMQTIMMKDKTIESMMDSASFRKFNEGFSKITGMSAKQLNNFKPSFHLSLLTLKTIPCLNFVQPETELMQIAKKQGKEVLGLETVEEQMDAIDAQPLDAQISSLQKWYFNLIALKI